MSDEREHLLDELQQRLGYRFRDPALLDRALTHRSYANESNRRDEHGIFDDNERLEYLGDSVWRLAVSELLYLRHPGTGEGGLTQRRRYLVQGGQQTVLGRGLGLGRAGLLRTGKLPPAEARRGEASRLEDAFEALVGALFLDAGYSASLAVLEGWILATDDGFSPAVEPKTQLQEALAAVGLPHPGYATVAEGGPAHEKWFECIALAATREGEPPSEWGRGRGGSKRKAQSLAARGAFEALVEAGVLAEPDGG
jgi:ribonuclease III